jgi:uncharacterized NAD-dependent epimerase/dehydratase family protein
VPIPPLPVAIRLYEAVAAAGGAFYPSRVVAIALNTAHLSESEARAAIEQTRQETGLPCTDPLRFGAEPLVDAVLSST